jgi:hypothetical protein
VPPRLGIDEDPVEVEEDGLDPGHEVRERLRHAADTRWRGVGGAHHSLGRTGRTSA